MQDNNRLLLMTGVITAFSVLNVALSQRAHILGGPIQQTEPTSAKAAERIPPARSIHLVIEDHLLEALGNKIPSVFQVEAMSRVKQEAILGAVTQGDSLVWIGEGNSIPQQLWVGTFRPGTAALAVTIDEHSPVPWKALSFRMSLLSSAYIKPLKLLPLNNVDEQPRVELLPLLEARDRFGQVVGYPGVLMQYYGPSTVLHRFAGSECFLFLFDRPAEALEPAEWEEVLEQIANRFRAHLQLKQVTTDYASYRLGERALIRARVTNWRPQAAATEIHFYSLAPGEKEFHEILKQRRCPDSESESEAVAEFVPRGAPGLWTIRVEAWQDPVHAEELGIVGKPVFVDRRDIGFVVLDGKLKTPSIMSLKGPSIQLDGQDGFWAGTNYYPSTSWWDWLWRDFRPLKVAEDFAAMRRTGYRLVRIWLDPVLDEPSLRATDAAIYLAARNGIVLDVCVFTIHQWVRTIGFERENGEHVSVDFARDTSLSSFSLQHIATQKELFQVLARRWRDVGNLIYDISNEPVVKDIDLAHADKEVKEWESIPKERVSLRDTVLFRRWAKEMTMAIRQAGGSQPVIPGILQGGDNYLGNRDADIESWHSYAEPVITGLTLSNTDPGCSGRPVILEEFGAWGVWNDEKHYDADVHYALAAGAAAAMSYEWGVSWLSPELNFWPPLADMISGHPSLQDVRGRPGFWRSVGIFPAPSGFNWGSIYHGTPFPAEAAIALGRLGRMGNGLGRIQWPEKVYVVVPGGYSTDFSGKDSVIEVIRRLWQEKAVFGILQEDCLRDLPKSAQVLICPKRVNAASEGRLDELRRSGVKVFTESEADWEKSARLLRLAVNPGDGVDLLVRRTVQGTLYSLTKSDSERLVTLKTERGNTVALGLQGFALACENVAGINWVEASHEVTIDGSRVCSIESGRVILVSDDGLDLARSKRVRLLATEPTAVEFSQQVESVAVLEENRPEPLTTFVPEGKAKPTLVIDSQLVRYVLRVTFGQSQKSVSN
jgi:hypothetical protein